jgi:hypothetical protein
MTAAQPRVGSSRQLTNPGLISQAARVDPLPSAAAVVFDRPGMALNEGLTHHIDEVQ